MATILMLKNKHGGALGLLAAGATVTVPDMLALDMVEEGAAQWVGTPPAFWPDANPAPVSGAGISDWLDRPVTIVRARGVEALSYGTDGKIKRQITSGRNYRLASGITLIDWSSTADQAKTATTNSGTTATVTVPATPDARPGLGPGVRIVTGTAAGDRGTATVSNMTNIPALTATDCVLVPAYIESCNSGDLITIFFSPDNQAAKSVSVQVSLNQNKLGRFDMLLPAALFGGAGGGLITDPMNSVRVQARHQNAGGVPTVVTIYPPEINPKQVPRVMVDFDDFFLSQYTEVFAYMQTKGLVGNIAVISDTVGKSAGQFDTFDYGSLAQLREMHAAGWGMLTHGYYPHNQVGTLDSDVTKITADIAKNKRYLSDNALTGNEQHYVYPAGQVVTAGGVSYAALAANGMATARGTMNNLINTSQRGLDQNYQLFCLSLSAQTGLAALQTALTRVVETGGTQIFCGHRVTVGAPVDAGNEISRADWRAFVDDLASKRDAGLLDVVTRQQWFAGLAA